MATQPDPRLATRIKPANDRRLRLTALVRNQEMREVLDELLEAHLPPLSELTDALAGAGEHSD